MTCFAKRGRWLARLGPVCAIVVLVLGIMGCSGGSPTETVPAAPITRTDTLTVSPRAVTLESNQQVLFRATSGSGASDVATSVQWTATGGTITSSGLYTAPATAGSYTVTARLAADSTSAIVTVTAPLPSSGRYPNQPASLRPVAATRFDGETLETSSLAGAWAGPAYGSENLATLVRDASNPLGLGAVAQIRWPAGLVAGDSPTRFDGWDRLSGGSRYRKIYVSMWVKIPSPDFENQRTGTKLWYLAHGNTVQGNADFLMLEGNYQGTAVMSAMKMVMYISPADERVFPGSQPYSQNVDSRPLFTCGTWHQVEVYMDVGTVGNADGTVRVWIDGTKVMDYTQRVKFLDAAYDFTQGFYNLEWTPVWGGTGGTKARTDYMRTAELYIAGGN